ncbi:MAG: hypothetical protein WC712_12825, partial [Candidatus Brocadiia bacterium]
GCNCWNTARVTPMRGLVGVTLFGESIRLWALTAINSGPAIRLSGVSDLLLNCGQCDDRKDEE